MDEEVKVLLDKLEKSTTVAAKDREKALTKEDQWVARFDEVRRKVIRPTLEKLGDQIRLREHDYNIVEAPFRRENRAIPEEASIRMDLYLATERTRTIIGADRRPFLEIKTHHRSETVQVTLCDITARGGVISKVGDFPLDKVDEPFIRDKFRALLNRLVAQAGPG